MGQPQAGMERAEARVPSAERPPSELTDTDCSRKLTLHALWLEK
jgi:hypothetical protein